MSRRIFQHFIIFVLTENQVPGRGHHPLVRSQLRLFQQRGKDPFQRRDPEAHRPSRGQAQALIWI
jgi:hypothetical protein